MVDGFDLAPGRPDKDELESKSVLASDNPLLCLAVIGGGTKVPKDHLRDPDIMLRMLRDVDTVSIIGHSNDAIVADLKLDP